MVQPLAVEEGGLCWAEEFWNEKCSQDAALNELAILKLVLSCFSCCLAAQGKVVFLICTQL